jgi:hypothetical protein
MRALQGQVHTSSVVERASSPRLTGHACLDQTGYLVLSHMIEPCYYELGRLVVLHIMTEVSDIDKILCPIAYSAIPSASLNYSAVEDDSVYFSGTPNAFLDMLADCFTMARGRLDWRSVLLMNLFNSVPILVADFKTTAIRLITA